MDYTQSLGALFSKKDVRDYKIDCTAAPVEFPTEFELKMPKVKDQGQIGSCVAHSIATTIEYFNNLQQSNNESMSVGYIYGNRTNTTHTGPGMYTRDAIAVTCKYGDVAEKLFPYNEEPPTVIEKFNEASERLFELSQHSRFSSYYRLYKENEIKTSLMKNGPVIFAMQWYDDIKVVNGIITTSQKGDDSGGHCMVIYGWNEQGWKIQNSWSRRWGTDGRAILPYNIKIREAWGIIDTITSGSTDIIKPYTSNIGKFIAKILNACVNAFYYITDTIKNIKDNKGAGQ